jgi:hypothetical protein
VIRDNFSVLTSQELEPIRGRSGPGTCLTTGKDDPEGGLKKPKKKVRLAAKKVVETAVSIYIAVQCSKPSLAQWKVDHMEFMSHKQRAGSETGSDPGEHQDRSAAI